MIEINYNVDAASGWKKNFPYFKKYISKTVNATLSVVDVGVAKNISITFLCFFPQIDTKQTSALLGLVTKISDLKSSLRILVIKLFFSLNSIQKSVNEIFSINL